MINNCLRNQQFSSPIFFEFLSFLAIVQCNLQSIVQVNLCQKLLFLQNMGRTCCVHKLFWMSKSISVHSMFSPCSELVIFTYWTCNSTNNMSSYCGLVDAKIRASDKDLPAQASWKVSYKSRIESQVYTSCKKVKYIHT